MKKLAVIAMSCMLALSGTSVVLAEEEVPTSFDVTMLNEELYEGSWINAFDVFDFYLPNDWVITCNGEEGEKSDEDVLFNAQSEDEVRNMNISYGENAEFDLSAFVDELLGEGADYAEVIEVNGIPAAAYVMSEDEAICNGLVVPTEDGGMYNIIFTSMQGDDEFNSIGSNIVCSMQIHEE